MATIYSATDGTILQALLSSAEERQYTDPPLDARALLRFDHDTNADLVADLHRSTDPYRLSVDGVLTKDGEPVTINPPIPPPLPAVDLAAIGLALAQLPDDAPLTKADLAPLLALFGSPRH